MDYIVFGNIDSENAHGLIADFSTASNPATMLGPWVGPNPSTPSASAPSEVISGGQGVAARRLLPRTPNADIYGGQLTFCMNVDPKKQNYVTVKLWGGDSVSQLLLLNINGKEIGNRHGGEGFNVDPLDLASGAFFLNRFFYRAVSLPLSETRDKTQVTLTIRSLGYIYGYADPGAYVPAYQNFMAGPSRGLYAAYTHTGGIAQTDGETQGTAPLVLTPRPDSDIAQLEATKTNVNRSFATKLNASPPLDLSSAADIARIYDAKTTAGETWITYPAGKSSDDVRDQIIASLDKVVRNYALDPSTVNGWGGAFAPMGESIRLAWPLLSSSLDTTVSYDGLIGTVTRRAAWSKTLRASVDAGRFYRRTIANQEVDSGWNVYVANRGLLLIDPANALLEKEALRYIKEACGILPYIGSDLQTGGTDGLGGGPIPTRSNTPPYGPDWYMTTTKGTTKDGTGFVGSDYGELSSWIYKAGLLSGDRQLLDRGIVMARGRAPFRFPSVDESGYRVMMGTNPIGLRSNVLPAHHAYLGRNNSDDMLMAAQGAAAIGPDVLGSFQQLINDGQAPRNFYTLDPYLPGRWAAIKAMPQTAINLPTTTGMPDYAWVDEENMVVSAKHGEERFYANLYWRGPDFINGLAKVFHLTPESARIAEVSVEDIRFRSAGRFIITGTNVGGKYPPDKPVNAHGNLYGPVALRSDLSSEPPINRDGGRGTGYTLRYGHWLVAINAHHLDAYTVPLPLNFTASKDYTTGRTLSAPVILPPKSSVVFYLPESSNAFPAPSRPVVVHALPGGHQVFVSWVHAASAETYTVFRSTTPGSGYLPVATSITTDHFIDTRVNAGTTYYYVVVSVNSIGISGYSPEASATPVVSSTPSLVSPWSDTGIANTTGGSTTLSGATIAVKSSTGQLYRGNDLGGQYAYQPLIGDGVVTARVQSLDKTIASSVGGLMIRSTLATNAIHAAILIDTNGRAIYRYRNRERGDTGGSATNISTPVNWVRLARKGPVLSAYYSLDGLAWTLLGESRYPEIATTALVGLYSSTGTSNPALSNTTTFTDVTLPYGAPSLPSAPSGLTITVANTLATLEWTASPGAYTYTILRSTTPSGPFTPIATGVPTADYTDYGINNSIRYYYKVVANNSKGSSPASATAFTPALAQPPEPLAHVIASPSTNRVTLSWPAALRASTYTIERAVNGGDYVPLASGITTTTYADATALNTTLYAYKVYAVNSVGAGTGAAAVAMPPGLPADWQSLDIGDTGIPGGAGYVNGIFTLASAGLTIWNKADVFYFADHLMAGDGVITARITSVGPAPGSTTGVSIRDSLSPGSPHVTITVGSRSISLVIRANADQGTGAVFGPSSVVTYPLWVSLARVGSSFTASYSSDGLVWNRLGTRVANLSPTALVGLVNSSGNQSVINTSTYDNVTILLETTSGGSVTASSQNTGGEAYRLFDRNVSTKWYSSVGGAAWVQYQYSDGPRRIVQYRLTSAGDTPTRDPASWQLQGSNNGTTWTTLDTRSAEIFPARSLQKIYPVANPGSYTYYRLNITAPASGTDTGLQLGELGLYQLDTGTLPPPPPRQPFVASSWQGNQVTLSWPVVPDALTYTISRANTSGGPYSKIATGLSATTYTDTPLTSGITYYYVLTSENTGGESLPSNEIIVTPYDAPAKPVGIVATASASTIALRWPSVPTAQTYTVQRAPAADGPYADIFLTTAPSHDDTGLANGTPYYYRIIASNLGGNSAPSATVTATPPATLLAPSTLSAQTTNQTITLSWPSVSGATGYIVKRATNLGGPTYVPLGATTATTFTDPGLVNGATYYYIVVATTDTAQSRPSLELAATPVGPPVAPSAPVATPGNARIALAWPTVPGALTYTLQRATNTSGPYVNVATGLVSPLYIDTGLANGTSYSYVALAINAGGTSPASAPASATPVASPPAPTGLAATSGNASVALAWNTTLAASTYRVKRSLSPTAAFVTLIDGLSTPAYTDTSTANGTVYYYLVTALNPGGESPPSATVVGTPTQPPASPASFTALAGDNHVKLVWTPSLSAQTYTLRRSLAPANGYADLAIGITATTYTDTSTVNGTPYYYTLTALNLGGSSPDVGPVAATPSPYNTPTLTATPGDRVITLVWTPTPNATGYILSRATSPVGPFTRLTTPNPASIFYVDTGLANGTTYYYRVTANFGTASGPDSPPVAATPVFIPGYVNRATGGTATANKQTGGGEATRAFDANPATKWFSSMNGGTGWLLYQFPSGTAWTVTEYRLTSANDIPERDPRDWQLQGSNDGSTWTTLDTRTDEAFTTRAQTKIYTPATTATAYAYYRLNITANAGGSAFSLQLAELELRSAALPSEISSSAYLLERTTSGTSYSKAGDPAPAFDANPSTKWYYPAFDAAAWLQYRFPAGLAWAVNRYTLTSGNDVPARDPLDWRLQGSNDGSTWSSLDTRTGEIFAARRQTKAYDFLNTIPYRYYRLDITANAGGKTATIQLSDLTLYSPQKDPGDKTPPTLSTNNLTLPATTADGAIAIYAPTTDDLVDGPLTATCTPSSGTLLPIGNTIVTATARDAAGNQTTSTFTVTVAPLRAPAAPPTGALATPRSSAVTLTWSPVSGATSYILRRASDPSGPYLIVASNLSAANYTDTSLINGTTYYYRLTAANSAGESSTYTSFTATPLLLPDPGFEQPPVASLSYAPTDSPWDFSPSTTLDGSGLLSNSSTLRPPAAPQGAQAAFLQGNGSISQLIDGLVIGARYRLTLAAAQRAVGNHGGQTFNILLDQTPVGAFDPSASIYADLSLEFLATATSQTLSLLGTNLRGGDNLLYLDNLRLRALPSQPTGLAATPLSAAVFLAWNSTNGATAYHIYRAPNTSGPFTTIATTAASSYTDTPLEPGALYYYKIVATNGTDLSASSTTVTATPLSAATVVASVSANAAGNGSKALDGDPSTKWYTGPNQTTAWLQYQLILGTRRTATAYTLISANDVPARDPRDWQLLGSNDGNVWLVLDTRLGQAFTARLQAKTYSLSGIAPYTYYRLVITSNAGTNSSDGIQLSEFALALAPLPALASDIPPSSLNLAPAANTLTQPGTDTGRTYQLQRSNTLAAGSWVNVGSPRPGNGGTLQLNDLAPPVDQPRIFYRILINTP